MDWIELREKAVEAFKKYRYVLMVLLAGLVLMLLPERNSETVVSEEPTQQTLQEQPKALQDSLSELLSLIEGAGKVQVLLTQTSGERIHYQTDEDISTGENTSDVRRETIIITDSSRSETGLVQQVDAPIYQGAVILCQGADRATVRLAIVEAVANATGLSTDKISVLKMKG